MRHMLRRSVIDETERLEDIDCPSCNVREPQGLVLWKTRLKMATQKLKSHWSRHIILLLGGGRLGPSTADGRAFRQSGNLARAVPRTSYSIGRLGR
jgi:hypothetical protein